MGVFSRQFSLRRYGLLKPCFSSLKPSAYNRNTGISRWRHWYETVWHPFVDDVACVCWVCSDSVCRRAGERSAPGRQVGVVLRFEQDASRQTRAVVAEVLPNSPAERAGLRRGDVLIAISGTKVDGCTTPPVRLAMGEPLHQRDPKRPTLARPTASCAKTGESPHRRRRSSWTLRMNSRPASCAVIDGDNVAGESPCCLHRVLLIFSSPSGPISRDIASTTCGFYPYSR